MKKRKSNRFVWALGLFAISVLLSACGASFQAGGDVAQGRQALFRGDNQGALGYFQSAAQINPTYVYGGELREGVLSFLGRAQYLNGELAAARTTLQKALAQHNSDILARLYLGLTLARLGDRQAGLRDIEAGIKGIKNFLNYITTAFGFTFGQYWDPGQTIRKTCDANLALIARGNINWSTLISNAEALALTFEQEPDRALQDQNRRFGN